MEFVKQKMFEYGITKYDIQSKVLEVGAGTEIQSGESNDFLLLCSFYTDSNAAKGHIRNADSAIVLNAASQGTVFYKHKFFKGTITVKNSDPANKLIIEFIRIIPINC
jgi:hypothetical protein